MSRQPIQLPLFVATNTVLLSLFTKGPSFELLVANFHVDGMDFWVVGANDVKATLSVALDGLVSLSSSRLDELTDWLGGDDELDITPSEQPIRVTVTVRQEKSSGVIEVHQEGDVIKVDLPHASLWDAHGLWWVRPH